MLEVDSEFIGLNRCVHTLHQCMKLVQHAANMWDLASRKTRHGHKQSGSDVLQDAIKGVGSGRKHYELST